MAMRERRSDGPDPELARALGQAAAEEQRRATPALAFLGAYALINVVQIAVSALATSGGPWAERRSTAIGYAGVLTWLSFAGMAVSSLSWLHLAVANSRAFGPRPVGVTPGWAVASFVIPVVNLVRPFFILRDLVRASDPNQVADTPRYEERAGGGYRDSPVKRLPPIRWARSTPLAAWWATVVASRIAPYFVTYSVATSDDSDYALLASFLFGAQTLAAASAILAALLARGIASNRAELYRRMIAEAAGAVGGRPPA